MTMGAFFLDVTGRSAGDTEAFIDRLVSSLPNDSVSSNVEMAGFLRGSILIIILLVFVVCFYISGQLCRDKT